MYKVLLDSSCICFAFDMCNVCHLCMPQILQMVKGQNPKKGPGQQMCGASKKLNMAYHGVKLSFLVGSQWIETVFETRF